jgi:hypothetical protein
MIELLSSLHHDKHLQMSGNSLDYHSPTTFAMNIENYKQNEILCNPYLSNFFIRRPNVPEENSFSTLAYSNWLCFKINVHLLKKKVYLVRWANI